MHQHNPDILSCKPLKGESVCLPFTCRNNCCLLHCSSSCSPFPFWRSFRGLLKNTMHQTRREQCNAPCRSPLSLSLFYALACKVRLTLVWANLHLSRASSASFIVAFRLESIAVVTGTFLSDHFDGESLLASQFRWHATVVAVSARRTARYHTRTSTRAINHIRFTP